MGGDLIRIGDRWRVKSEKERNFPFIPEAKTDLVDGGFFKKI